MKKNRRMFHARLEEKTHDALEALAEKKGISKTAVVENLIIEAYEKKLIMTEDALEEILKRVVMRIKDDE